MAYLSYPTPYDNSDELAKAAQQRQADEEHAQLMAEKQAGKQAKGKIGGTILGAILGAAAGNPILGAQLGGAAGSIIGGGPKAMLKDSGQLLGQADALWGMAKKIKKPSFLQGIEDDTGIATGDFGLPASDIPTTSMMA